MRPVAGAVVVVAAVAAAGSAVYQRAAERMDRRRFAPPGELVDIGGRRLHLLAAGTGSPPLVIIPALASNVLEWVRVQRALAAETTVYVYDRAGTGWSDPPGGRLSLDAAADDLHALLQAAGVAVPVIVAGHSLGGVIARRFQARYPGEVAGMLLADSSHEQQARRLGRAHGVRSNLRRAARRQARVLGLRRAAAAFGWLEAVGAESIARETVPEYADAARAITLSSRQRRISVRELLLLARPQGQPRQLGSLPLTVITAASADRRSWPAWPAWSVLQDELAALSADSVHLAATSAGHNVHLDDPEIIVCSIRELLRRCGQGSSSPPGTMQAAI